VIFSENLSRNITFLGPKNVPSHCGFNKHQRNTVSHYTMWQNRDFGLQKNFDNSNQLFRFAFANTVDL